MPLNTPCNPPSSSSVHKHKECEFLMQCVLSNGAKNVTLPLSALVEIAVRPMSRQIRFDSDHVTLSFNTKFLPYHSAFIDFLAGCSRSSLYHEVDSRRPYGHPSQGAVDRASNGAAPRST